MDVMDRALNDPTVLVEAQRQITNKTATSLVPVVPQESSEVLPQNGMGCTAAVLPLGLLGLGTPGIGWLLGGPVRGWLHHGVRTGDVGWSTSAAPGWHVEVVGRPRKSERGAKIKKRHNQRLQHAKAFHG